MPFVFRLEMNVFLFDYLDRRKKSMRKERKRHGMGEKSISKINIKFMDLNTLNDN